MAIPFLCLERSRPFIACPAFLAAPPNAILENSSIAFSPQEFVEEAKLGDHRLVFINYELLGKKVVRIPSDKDFRGNLAAGAISKIETVTKHDKNLAENIVPYLKENKIFFAGVDLLGGWLSEINITSPTCLQEIHKNSDLDPAKIFWDSLKKDR